MEWLVHAAHLDQNWALFAPRPAYFDRWLFMPGQLESGEEVELFDHHGYLTLIPNPPKRRRAPQLLSMYGGRRWFHYLDHTIPSASARAETLPAFCRRWNEKHLGGNALWRFSINMEHEWHNLDGTAEEGEQKLMIEWQCYTKEGAEQQPSEVAEEMAQDQNPTDGRLEGNLPVAQAQGQNPTAERAQIEEGENTAKYRHLRRPRRGAVEGQQQQEAEEGEADEDASKEKEEEEEEEEGEEEEKEEEKQEHDREGRYAAAVGDAGKQQAEGEKAGDVATNAPNINDKAIPQDVNDKAIPQDVNDKAGKLAAIKSPELEPEVPHAHEDIQAQISRLKRDNTPRFAQTDASQQPAALQNNEHPVNAQVNAQVSAQEPAMKTTPVV